MSVTRLNQQRVDFYVGLLDDLLDIVERLETCGGGVIKKSEGAVVAKVEMSGFKVEIGMEYFIYINTYGIPADGVFEEAVLERIRNNMPLPPQSGCGGCRKIICCCSATCAPAPSCPSEPPEEDASGCNSACHTCHLIVCCCNSGCGGGCTDCSGNDTTTDETTGDTTGETPTLLNEAPTTNDTPTTDTTPNGTDRIDNESAGGGELGIVILE